MEGDQGWCSAVLVIEIRDGNADGVNLGGTKVALAADWPSGFLAGNGTGRLYLDEGLTEQQRGALEGVLSGSQGGMPADVLKALVPNMLPSRVAPITINKDGDDVQITVGGFGEAVVKPRKGPTGELTRLMHGAAAIRENVIWGDGKGTNWRDPDLRQWQSLGHGEMSELSWSA
jgi:hypothetical protein